MLLSYKGSSIHENLSVDEIRDGKSGLITAEAEDNELGDGLGKGLR